MDINVEYKNQAGFPVFFKKISGKKVVVLFDVNTKKYADEFISKLKNYAGEVSEVFYPDEELVPDEAACKKAFEGAAGVDYVLAVGSGTLNDMAKSVSTRRGVPCGVLATAASMDGYCSKGAALMRGAKMAAHPRVTAIFPFCGRSRFPSHRPCRSVSAYV